LAIIGKQVTEFCLTEAARVGQNSLKDALKVAWRTGDCVEHLGGRRLLLQRLGKVPPHLGELTGARFELLFQLARRIGPVANARFRLRSGRTKLAAARRSTICTFARQGHLVGTVTGPPGGGSIALLRQGKLTMSEQAVEERRGWASDIKWVALYSILVLLAMLLWIYLRLKVTAVPG